MSTPQKPVYGVGPADKTERNTATRVCELLHSNELTKIGRVSRLFYLCSVQVLYRKLIIDGGDGYYRPVRDDHSIPNSVKGTIVEQKYYREFLTGVCHHRVARHFVESFVWLGPAVLGDFEKLAFVEFFRAVSPKAFITHLFPAGYIQEETFDDLETLKIGITKYCDRLRLPKLKNLLIGYGEGDRHLMALFAEMLIRGNTIQQITSLEFVCIKKVDINEVYEFMNQDRYHHPSAPWRIFFETLYERSVKLELKKLVLDGHMGIQGYEMGTWVLMGVRLHNLVLLELRVLEMLFHRGKKHRWMGRGYTLAEFLTLRCKCLKKLAIHLIHECAYCLYESLTLALSNCWLDGGLDYLWVLTVFPSDEVAKAFNEYVVDMHPNLKTLEIIDGLKAQRDRNGFTWSVRGDNVVEEYEAALVADEKVRLCVNAEKPGFHLEKWHGGLHLGQFVTKWKDRGLERLIFYHLNYGFHPRMRSSFVAPKHLKFLKRCTVLRIPLDMVRNVYRPVWYDAHNQQQMTPRKGD